MPARRCNSASGWAPTAASASEGWTIDDVVVQSCPAACPYNVNGTGGVDIVDVQLVAGAFGTNTPAYDFDQDGSVDVDDIVAVAQRWIVGCQ